MRVIIESPFAGTFANVKYSREAIKDSLTRGESPYASHLLYTQKGILDDKSPADRTIGMEAATAWLSVSDYVVVYCDLGISPGMAIGILKAIRMKKPIKFRWIRDVKREIE
jgi:hypothetical protein